MIRPYLDRFPLVAILRGITPDAAVAVGRALVAHGFTVVEVPLNSPDPFESIRRLAEALGPEVLVGAGTVTAPEQVAPLRDAGGRLVVMPHSDLAVVRAAGADPDRPLALIGDPALCARYRRALSVFDVVDAPEIEGAAEAGLWRIAVAAGLVDARE